MKKLFTFFALFFAVITTIFAQTNQRYYWVGAGANNNWGTIENWSSTSGGAAAMGITSAPANVNTVVFDQNSFLVGNNVIIIDGAVQCDSLLVQNCTTFPHFDFRGDITISGSLYLQKGTTFSYANMKLVSSRPQETIYSDSLVFSSSTILCNGGANTIWNLAGYTEFYDLRITYGSFNLEATDFIVSSYFSYNGNADINLNGKNISSGNFYFVSSGNIDLGNANININCPYDCNIFSYRGNGNVNLNNANITQGDFYLNGNGIISLNEVNIDNNSFSYTGSSNIDLHGLSINCDYLFYLYGNGNFDLYETNINARMLEIYGNGNIDLHETVANCTRGFTIQGNGNIDMHNADVRVAMGSFVLQGNNINLNNTIIFSITYINIYAVSEMFLVNSNISCDSWTYSGADIAASQSDGSLIKCTVFYGGGMENNYYYVEMTGNDNQVYFATCKKINVPNGNCLLEEVTGDTILLLGGGHYIFNNLQVEEYLDAKTQTCGGQIILSGSYLTISSTANYIIEGAIIYDLIASTWVTAQKSHDWGNNTNILFTAPDVGRDMYWRGGNGNWYDPAKWYLADNSPANCVPTIDDNVFFDANSATASFSVSSSTPHTFCNSMTWNGAPANSYINSNKIYINGALTLNQNATMLATSSTPLEVYFTSNQPNNTITLNGSIISGNVNFQSVSGNGGWKIMGDFLLTENLNYGIKFNRGHLDLSGQNIYADSFTGGADNDTVGFSRNSPLRTIDFHDANIYLSDVSIFTDMTTTWDYTFGQPITPANSLNSNIIQTASSANSFLSKNNDYYYNLSHTGSYDDINCDTLSYFNKITFNTYPNGEGYISNAYTDSLIFATASFYTIQNKLRIKKYLSTPILSYCGEKTKLYGDNTTTTIQMDTDNPVLTDRVQVQDAEINNLSITNGPYEVSDCIITGNSTGWNNTGEQTSNQNRFYWVGGDGNWSDYMHWANTSGGEPGSAGCNPPTAANTVVFDDNSFTAPNQCVMVDVEAYCDSMLWIGNETLSPTISYSDWANIILMHGSLILQKNMAYLGASLEFHSTRPNETLQTNGVTINSNMNFAGSSNYTFLDSLNCSMTITYVSGTLNFNGQYVKASSFYSNTINGLVDIRNSEIYANSWYYYSNNLYADNSIIYVTQMFVGQNAEYNNVELVGGSAYIYLGKYNRVNATVPATFYNIETDTLILSKAANNIYSFSEVIKVNEAFYGSGTPCKQIYLQSLYENSLAVFDIKTACANLDNDTLLIDYVYLHGIKALTNSDNAKLKKGMSSPDVNKSGVNWGYGIGTNNYNEDWAEMLPYISGGSTYFGEDFYVPCENGFPYTLTSENFLPSYGAMFEWRKDNLASPIIAYTPSYEVTDSGTYYLTVIYDEGCSATDNVHIAIISKDSVSETICYGETFTGWGLADLDEASTYYNRYITAAGCDSIVFLTLNIRPQVDTTYLVEQICRGEIYNDGVFNVTDEGNYQFTTQNQNGCDSVIKLNLSYYSNIDTTRINAFICQGTTYSQNGFNENEEGIYYLTETSINYCDSVVELTLAFTELITDTIRAAICQGGIYNLNGFNKSEAGTYDLTSQTAAGCDSLTILILSVNEIIVGTEINASICEGGTYSGNGFVNLTEEDVYTRIEQTAAGCDSLITLNLSYYSNHTTEVNETICEGETYIFGTQMLTTSNTYEEPFVSSNGCDSVVTLHLIVAPAIKVARNGEVYVCADSAYMFVNYQTISAGVPNRYRLSIGNKEIDGGLSAWKNYEGDIYSDTQIEIPMPQNVRPSHYNVEIELSSTGNCGKDTLTVPFEVRYRSSIIEQKWDDVLALLNYNNNDGYNWSVYEWYKGGVKIPNANGAYYYVGGNGGKLEVGAVYQARLTRAGETEQVFSCGLVVVPFVDLLECPTVLSAQQAGFKVRTSTYTNAVIYTVTGIQIGSYPLVIGEINELPIPHSAGIYIVVFSDNDGKTETRKIVVN